MLAFETQRGLWVGSTWVYPTIRLEDLSEAELHNVLRQAIERELPLSG